MGGPGDRLDRGPRPRHRKGGSFAEQRRSGWDAMIIRRRLEIFMASGIVDGSRLPNTHRNLSDSLRIQAGQCQLCR
jgi:hypothetical protein